MKNSKIVQIMMVSLMLMGSMTQVQAFKCLFKAKPAIIAAPIIKTSVIRRAGMAAFNGMKRHKLATALGAALVTGFVADKLYANRVTKRNAGNYVRYEQQQQAVLAREAVVRGLENKHQALLVAEKKLNNAKELVSRSSDALVNGAGAVELAGLQTDLANFLLAQAKKYYGEGVNAIFATHETAMAEQQRAENLANRTGIYRDIERAECAKEIVRKFEKIEKIHAVHRKFEADAKQAQDEFNALLGSDASIEAVAGKIEAAKADFNRKKLELDQIASHANLKDKKQATLLRRAWDYARQAIVKLLAQ